MSGGALGMAKTKDLVGAVEAADTITKVTGVTFIGYEKIDSGLVTVTVRGDVGAARAPTDTGATAAASMGQVVPQYVIPRPHTDIERTLPKSLQDASKRAPVSVAGIQTSGKG